MKILFVQSALRRRVLPVVFTLLTAIGATATAKADSYTFSFSGGGMSGSGVLTYSNTPVPGVPGGYQITGITGSFSDSNIGLSNAAITGLQAIGLPTGINGDGTFLPPGRQVDGYPFSFDNLFYPDGNSPAVCPPPPPNDPNGPWPFGGGYFDIYGMYFTVAGGYSVDVWSNGVVPPLGGLTYGIGDALNGQVLNTVGEPFSGAYANVRVAPTPEPGSLLLLGTGVLGFAGTMARRMRRS